MKQYIKHKWRQDTFIENTYISTDLSVFFRVNEEKPLYKISSTVTEIRVCATTSTVNNRNNSNISNIRTCQRTTHARVCRLISDVLFWIWSIHWNVKSDNTCGVRLKCEATSQVFLSENTENLLVTKEAYWSAPLFSLSPRGWIKDKNFIQKIPSTILDFSGLRASCCTFLKVFFNTEFLKSPYVCSR